MLVNHCQMIDPKHLVIDWNGLCHKLRSIIIILMAYRQISFYSINRNWLNERKCKSKPSLWRAIVKTFWPEYLLTGILNVLFDIVAPITLPFLLKNLLEYFGYVWIVCCIVWLHKQFVFYFVWFCDHVGKIRMYLVMMHSYMEQRFWLWLLCLVLHLHILYSKSFAMAQKWELPSVHWSIVRFVFQFDANTNEIDSDVVK